MIISKKRYITLSIIFLCFLLSGCNENITYDYKSDKIINYTSEEETSFSKVKSSDQYTLTSFYLICDKDITQQQQPENNPFDIISIDVKNTGIFIKIDFKDSGYIKNFCMTINAGKHEFILKRALIDCSNSVDFYIATKSSNNIFGLKFSSFSWQSAKIEQEFIENFNQENSDNVCNIKAINLKIAKTANNSLNINSYFNLSNLFKNQRLYVLLENQHVQTDCYDFYLNHGISTVLQSQKGITQVKICIEKEEE